MSHTAQDLKGGPREWWKCIDNLRNIVARALLSYILLPLCSVDGFLQLSVSRIILVVLVSLVLFDSGDWLDV